MAPQRETKRKTGSGNCPLVHLPPNVLHLIFRDSVSHSNFTLSNTLLPHILSVMYRQVILQNVFKIAEFCASLVQRPELAKAVRAVVLASDPNDGDDEWMWWTMTTAGKGRLDELLSCKQDGSSAFSVFPPLLRSSRSLPQSSLTTRCTSRTRSASVLCKTSSRFLPNLHALTLDGHYVLLKILEPDYLINDPMPSLRVLNVYPADEEDYEDDGCFFHNITTYLPSLQKVTIAGGVAGVLPADTLNISPETHVAPRSSDLEELMLSRMLLVEIEFRVFASAFNALSKLHVVALEMYSGFLRDLALLPPSLKELDLDVGDTRSNYRPCPHQGHSATLHPKLGDSTAELPLFFPLLERLSIRGDIVSSATFSFLLTLPSLVSLTLKEHIALSTTSLLSLLHSRDSLPRFSTLHLSICSCPPSSPQFVSSRRQPIKKRSHWPPDMDYSGAKEVVKVAGEVGVEVQGNVWCATRQCEGREGHKCLRWYK